jgi:hypothetical protein
MTKCPKTKRSCWFSIVLLLFVAAYAYLYHHSHETQPRDRILTVTAWRIGNSPYWVSAAHIVNYCSDDISIPNDRLEVIKISKQYDLALLKGTQTGEGFNIAPINELQADMRARVGGYSDLGYTTLNLKSTGKKTVSMNKGSAYLKELDTWDVSSMTPRRKKLVGISGSPILLNDTNEVIGVLIQATSNKKLVLSVNATMLSQAFDQDFKKAEHSAPIDEIKSASIQRLSCKKIQGKDQ